MFPFKILEEKYRSIPDNVREAISSTEVNEKLQNIVNKYNLQFDEGEELTKEIGYVMLGLKSPDLFVKNVQRATELDRETAEKIVEEVNELIFKDIKSSLRESTQEVEDKSDFDKEERQEIRDELLQEIEKDNSSIIKQPEEKELVTDLIKKPSQELKKIKLETPKVSSSATRREGGNKNIITPKEIPIDIEPTPQPSEQNSQKNYTIDPYREPLE